MKTKNRISLKVPIAVRSYQDQRVVLQVPAELTDTMLPIKSSLESRTSVIKTSARPLVCQWTVHGLNIFFWIFHILLLLLLEVQNVIY